MEVSTSPLTIVDIPALFKLQYSIGTLSYVTPTNTKDQALSNVPKVWVSITASKKVGDWSFKMETGSTSGVRNSADPVTDYSGYTFSVSFGDVG